MSKEQVKKILKGAAIAAGAAALTALCQYLLGVDFGAWNPVVQALVGVVLNAIKVAAKL